jgi:argininosuccinate lyase
VNAPRITGRIAAIPAGLWNAEVLAPQFRYELTCHLPAYMAIEKVLAAEYLRMGLLRRDQAMAIIAVLSDITAGGLTADPRSNMSDIAFAIERHVLDRVDAIPAAWHADRSRNDYQACAQLMHARGRLLGCGAGLADCARAALALAERHTSTPMPGFTHLRPAQVVTPGFYLTALADQLAGSLRRILAIYDRVDACPLGAGPMAGQELPWDRRRMARLLGFAAAQEHPLVAVASRGWMLEIAAEFSSFGVTLSRFVTDIMTWGAMGLLDLPDELSGISSAMAQKRNFPILERIRGRTAHLTAYYLDAAMAQRGTPFSNSVEVAKEGGGERLASAFDDMSSVLALLGGVLGGMTFDADRTRAACVPGHLGAFSLANLLTLRADIPWREAQVITGEYAAVARAPAEPELLTAIAGRHGHAIADAAGLLAIVTDPDQLLRVKDTECSTHPTAVKALAAAQRDDLVALSAGLARRAAAAIPAGDDRLLSLDPDDIREAPCATRVLSTRSATRRCCGSAPGQGTARRPAPDAARPPCTPNWSCRTCTG